MVPVSASNRVILRLPANSHRADLKGRIWVYAFLMLRDGESGEKFDGVNENEGLDP